MPPKKSNSDNQNIPAISINNTLDLLNDFESKKKYFEESIAKLNSFNPSSVSPSRENRQSPRLHTPTSVNNISSPSSNQPDFSVIIHQMNYLFETNIKLIGIVNDLRNKFDIVESKTETLACENLNFQSSINKINKDLESKISAGDEQDTSRITSETNNTVINFKNIENKLEKLEQYEANKYIVCQGTKVEELMNASKDNLNIKEVLKDHFASILDPESVPVLDEIITVKIYGRDKKILKLELSNNIKKNLIISTLKRKRPSGLYISEFLIPAKLKLFHQVRLFSKTIPEKIERVFTRNGVIYYKNKMTGQIHIIDNEISFQRLKNEIAA